VRVVFDLSPQRANSREQRLLARAAVLAVLRFEEPLIGNDAPNVADEKRQDFKFRRRQSDRLAVARDDVVKDIYFQGSMMVDCFLAFGLEATTKHGTDARKQLARAQRLLDIIVRTEIKGGDEVGFRVSARKRDHGNVRPTACLDDRIATI